jgi:hypothetical protein
MKHNVPRHAVVQPLDQSYRIIPLTQGKNTLMSASRYEFINQWNWFAELDKRSGDYYACRRDYSAGSCRRITMHSILLQGDFENVDHWNGDTLDNRDENLRPSSVKENSRNRKRPKDNTSGFKGVWWRKEKQKWVATIRVDGRHIYIGSHVIPTEAARLYDRAAIKYFGEFARLNFPRSDYK